MKKIVLLILMPFLGFSQNYNFDFGNIGRRVCRVSSVVNITIPNVKIIIHDSVTNTTQPITISRRPLNTNTWTTIASNLPPNTGNYIDNNVVLGQIWEYQVKRNNTFLYNGTNYNATGYTLGTLAKDNSLPKGQMILLVANDMVNNLSVKYNRLKSELSADGWQINELVVPRATNWDSGNQVVTIKNQIINIYNNAAANDKPKVLFILGHVPLPRSGSADIITPDDHNENKGARGCDAYYADIDGLYTDTATFNPGNLATPLAVNVPGDFKWDQDFFPSNIEMGFGRVDFADLTDTTTPELTLLGNYLDRLSAYRNVSAGYEMGEKSGFFLGFDNSNDGSYRSLLNISKPTDVYQNFIGGNHNQWVANNGPFKIYMQNLLVPDYNEWVSNGMNATVYSSDQSYWGFGDVPQTGIYSRIRSLLAANTKCLVTLWTTTGINIFHRACNGEPFGVSLVDIMNHNATNNILEKPEQEYDETEWWNRTHFAYYGDPTISLYQVKPISALTLTNNSNNALLQWVASTDNVLGYHIYQSTTENGKYERITATPISTTNYILPNYIPNNWYMVKAVKNITSGCGQFIQPSIGIKTLGNIVLNNNSFLESQIGIFPNPTKDSFYLVASFGIQKVEIYNSIGQKVFDENFNNANEISVHINALQSNVYKIKITNSEGNIAYKTLVKE
jgi:Secretion system C-terminal sorting domain